MDGERMLKWFEYAHLPEGLQFHSKPFFDLANVIVVNIQAGPERTVALRKLLEAKDAAIRAVVHPAGRLRSRGGDEKSTIPNPPAIAARVHRLVRRGC